MTQRLKYAINQLSLRRSVLFLGAGFSKLATNQTGANMLAGAELAAFLARELNEDPNTDLDTIAGLYSTELGRRRLLEVLKHQFHCTSFDESQSTILSMPWRRIYTTNYDNVIEQVLDRLGTPYRVLTRTDRPEADKVRELSIVHLNGYIRRVDEDNFDDEILLTDYQYLTNDLISSPWSTKMRTDFHVARNVFFVGYSMSDFEISKILFESGITGQKLFFIQAEELSQPHLLKLERFGEVHPIGILDFSRRLPEAARSPKKDLERGFLVNFREVHPLTSDPVRPTTEDAYALLFRGDFRRECMNWDLANGAEHYRAKRHQIEELEQLLGTYGATILLHSDIGNGKKLLAEELLETALSKGKRCFRLEALSDNMSDDLAFLEYLSAEQYDIVLFVPDYYSHERIVDSLRAALPRSVILTTASSAARELRRRIPRIAGESYYDVSLNELTNDDVSRLDSLIAAYGYWGELAGRSTSNRRRFIRERCGRSLRSVMLFLFDQPQIKTQLQDLLAKAKLEGAESFSCFVKFLALGANGSDLSFKDICEILGVTFANRIIKDDDSWVSEFFERRRGRQVVKSAIFAQYLLRNLVSDRIVMDELIDLVEDLDVKAAGQPFYRRLRTFPLRFSFVERLLDDEGKRSKLIEYYETVRQRGIGQNNPQFWLQYAIARMSFKDYHNAESYFETAFALSESMKRYDDYQIKNHYARFLLESCIEDYSTRDPVEIFFEAHEILVEQIQRRSQGHYPYRVALHYLDFIEKKHEHFGAGELEKFRDACLALRGYIDGSDRDLSRNNYVRRCRENTTGAIDFISEII